MRLLSPSRGRLLVAPAVVLACCSFLASARASSADPARPQISLSVPAEAASGSQVVATGNVKSFDRRGRVLLQTRRAGAWKLLASGAAHAGRFRVKFVFAGTEGASLRAELVSGGHGIATSPTRQILLRSAVVPPPAPATPPPPPPSPPPTVASTTVAPVEVPPSGVYWGAWVGPHYTGTLDPEDAKAVTEFEGRTRKPLSLLETFAGWATCSGAEAGCEADVPFQRAKVESMRNYGAIPVYSWASEGSGEANAQPTFQLADIIAGKFDRYIRGWAEEAKAWGHPFFLRFDWEMNGNWFPWSESINGNHPGEFVRAWQHVHDIFTEVGATNVSWVWCPYVNPNGNLQSPATLYPGDENVDWTGLDGYNRGTTSSPNAAYRSFDFLFGPNYREITGTIAPTKPMLLAEVASSEHGGSKSEWISDMFGELPSAYPQVKGLMWFDYYDQGNDWPIETSTAATEAFAAGISDPRYLPNAFAATGEGPVAVP